MAFAKDVSLSLDALSQVPGSYLWRGPQFWEAAVPSSPNSGGCRVRRTPNWNPTSTGNYNPITWNNLDFQNAILWDPGNPQIFTADITGWYTASFKAQNLNNGGTFDMMAIMVNGTVHASNTMQIGETGNKNWRTITTTFFAEAGDEFYPAFYTNNTNRQWINLSFDVFRV